MRTFEETAVAFHRACSTAQVEYAFVGGLAVNAWGIPRNTADIDVLVHLDRARAAALSAALRAEGLAAQEADLDASFDDRSHVTVFDDEGSIHLDLKLVHAPEEIEQVKSAVDVQLPRGPVRIARPEDTVVFKLKFGSPQDVADARGILARQRQRLDSARLQRLAGQLGVEEELRRLLDEVDGAA